MHLFIDESGSLTKKNLQHNINQKFIICIVKANEQKKLKKAYKEFINEEKNNLRGASSNAMFKDSEFFELKGSAMSIEMQRKFIKKMCACNSFELFYLVVDNKAMPSHFFNKTSRIFNYAIKEAMIYMSKEKFLERGHIFLQIDDRNVKRETRDTLEEYLNTEVAMLLNLQDKFDVEYFKSHNNSFVQIADVFSNIMYKQQKNRYYSKEFKMMIEQGILKSIYCFPRLCNDFNVF